MIAHRFGFACGTLALCALAGCTGSPAGDLQQELQEMTAGVRGKIQPLPVLVPYEPFVYRADDLIDPFAPVKISAKLRKSGSRPDASRQKEQLEAYPLETMRMVGYVKLVGVPYAVVAIDGITYRVKTGAYLGQNLGRVTDISEGRVLLKETIEDGGDWIERSSELLLNGTNEGMRK